MAKLKKSKYNIRIFFFFLFLLLVLAFRCIYYDKDTNEIYFLLNSKVKEEKEREEALTRQRLEEYSICLNKKYTSEELTEEIIRKKQEVDNLIVVNKYKTSVYFEDINTGFTYTYQPNTSYYGASLIKLVEALYLINKAIDGEINLDTETITYTEAYKKSFSSGMATHKYGDAVTLRDLITYAIAVSDNSAHLMLYDYIGRENLKTYGQSLGGKYIMTGSDTFGNQSAADTNLYLKEAYRIITENEEYGSFLKIIMDNNVRNSFNTDTIKIYHKYGAYDIYYHDIGLNLEEHPYAISIFTLHEDKNYKEVVQNIHTKIRELQDLFYIARENACRIEVYGE